ncbi:Hydrogenase maturation protein, carbamoyltransferase HypF [Oscillatoria nigro-viridis PCC 7112]|uniref:acylphosphatase n=1 Tax=Phormidium nigroviride PCC 7112 TaxID=179408 RepID=K9VEP0_9CYAN|nr:carbamoyltransferase HypF [Oscillatoria nigro-viridis]AFZ05969.1 Hydrogenase maturation protein, carbamoyltransferase HypF [Oscillatoria nigro-viridis PCC 7112]
MLTTESKFIQNSTKRRLCLTVEGIVQGVGFRPFVYGLAKDVGVVGWVKNTDRGVSIDIEGTIEQLQIFQKRLQQEKPHHAFLQHIETQWMSLAGYTDFEIRPSDAAHSSIATPKSALILPDLATCRACLHEIYDPANRRYRYPFTNCTHCGPRFSILRSLPYDRPNTTMQRFQMCPECRAEYENPLDRRFHAQPNACPTCGPHLELWDRQGKTLATHDEALLQTANAIRQGKILAIKGLGGFHVVVDAGNETAVRTLRDRKRRPDKPLALMYPSLELIREHCQVSEEEEKLLLSSEAPIVLLQSKIHNFKSTIAPSVAPGNPYLGVMLPYTPLHHLLLSELGFPIVATSGNLSSEPICTDELDALNRLQNIADLFLVHDRPIARPVDDSIVRVVGEEPIVLHEHFKPHPSPPLTKGREQEQVSPLTKGGLRGVRSIRADRPIVLRRARGYAPFPITPPSKLTSHDSSVILAVGAHLKNTVALYLNHQILMSQHLGDLDNLSTIDRFQEAIHHLLNIYEVQPTAIATDAHPDYYSTQFANALIEVKAESKQATEQKRFPSALCPLPSAFPTSTAVIPVQHHYAHVLSCMVDNQLEPPVLGIAWDGTGYGLDGTIWGGEFLNILANGFERTAHLRSFPLPGGEQAVKEPRRCALGLLYECFGNRAFEMLELASVQAFSRQKLKVLQAMLQRELNTPKTSSAGRLFDAIAALLGLCQQASFEGQAAMQLEFAANGFKTDEAYPYELLCPAHSPMILDYSPMLNAILDDIHEQISQEIVAAKFHNTLIEGMVAIANRVGVEQIVLTGGCFQNRYLLERAIARLKTEGFSIYWHHRIPTNDGGIAAGQIMAALRTLQNQSGGE